MKTKYKYVKLHSAESIIEKVRRLFPSCKIDNKQKNKKEDPWKTTMKEVIKESFYNDYDVNSLFPKLKPYFLGEKEIESLQFESFIVPKGIKMSEFTEKKKEQLEREERLSRMQKSVERAGGQQKLWWTEK